MNEKFKEISDDILLYLYDLIYQDIKDGYSWDDPITEGSEILRDEIEEEIILRGKSVNF